MHGMLIYSSGGEETLFQSKYMALFIVVVVGSFLLVTLMTLSEVINRRKAAAKERREMMEQQTANDKQSSITDSITGTFRSQLNGDVSFRSVTKRLCRLFPFLAGDLLKLGTC